MISRACGNPDTSQIMKAHTVDPKERRSGVRSAMRAASQLPGRGGPLMWMMPLHLHVNKKSDYDMILTTPTYN